MMRSYEGVESFCFGRRVPGERILLIKRPERLVEYQALLERSEQFQGVWQGVTGVLGGCDVSVVATGIGPSNVGDCLRALGYDGRVCLYAGTCGALDPALEIGDYFVATRAVCGDGYSLSHGIEAFSHVEAHADTAARVAKFLGRNAGQAESGPTFTTATFMEELDPRFWRLVPRDCRTIEMGAAAAYAAARAGGVRAAAYFWITDRPRERLGFLAPLPPAQAEVTRRRFEEAPRLDLELLASLDRGGD